MLEIAGPVADLILEQDIALELGIGRAAVVGRLLDPLHQRLDDGQELLLLPFGGIGGVEEGV